MKNIQKRIEDALDSMLIDMSQQKITYNKPKEFRVSGFPFCAIRNLLFTTSTDSFSMGFYTSIGTAVHETAQKWLALSGFKGKIFACWKALETGEVIGPCFKDEIPKSWDNYTVVYEEITIKYRGLSGHVDLVVEILPGYFIVVDFKTTDLSGKKRTYPNWRNYYPASRSSIMQISTYATLLRKIHNLNIVAWSLVYVDRGKVIQTKNDYHKVTVRWTPSKHKNMLRMINQACENNRTLVALNKLIAKSTGYSKAADDLLKDLVRNRPCVDDASYDAYMDYGFYSGFTKEEAEGVKKGKCVMKDHCLDSNKSCYKAVQRRL